MHRDSTLRLHCSRLPFLIAFAFCLAISARAQENPKPIWSASLKPQGFHRSEIFPANNTAIGGVAPTRDVVAVALGIRARDDLKQGSPRRWEVSLILYDSRTGALIAKKGPWESGHGFCLRSTSDGRLLLFLPASLNGNHPVAGKLLLLSSFGDVIKELLLDSFGGAPTLWVSFMASASLRTILLIARWPDQVVYRVLDANNLDTRMDWNEVPTKTEPRVYEISDDQMLGTSNDGVLFVRSFNTSWRVLRTPRLSPSRLIYLPNVAHFGGSGVVLGPAQVTEEGFEIPILKEEDGNIISAQTAPKLYDYIYFPRPLEVSSDRSLFGLEVMYENQLSHWWDHTLDIDPVGAKYVVYVWQIRTVSPVVRLETNGHMTELSFFPPGTREFVLLDGDVLKAFSLPRPESLSEGTRP